MLHRPTAVADKVGVVSCGSFGHIPVFAGYVGDGLFDACAVGDVFVSPDMNPMLESIQFADQSKGVLCVVGNQGGDRMNFDIADDEMEIGMGIHGEPGVRRGKLRPVDEITDEVIDMLLTDKPVSQGSRIALIRKPDRPHRRGNEPPRRATW